MGEREEVEGKWHLHGDSVVLRGSCLLRDHDAKTVYVFTPDELAAHDERIRASERERLAGLSEEFMILSRSFTFAKRDAYEDCANMVAERLAGEVEAG